ncbi:MAG: hypothetical protein AABZ47_16955, partial [Planctomycetota bacterium]
MNPWTNVENDRTTFQIHRSQRRRAAFFLVLILLGFGGLFGRLLYINTALHDPLVSIGSRQQKGQVAVPARRGMILDARGRVIAASRRLPDVYVDPSRVDDAAKLAHELSIRLNVPTPQIEATLRRDADSRYVVVASRVEEAEADAIRHLRHPAVGFTEREVRTYPLGTSMAHLLGLVGRDGRGLEGVEKEYDQHLRGHDGRRSMTVDARRRPLWPRDVEEIDPIDGGHLVLTVDAEIQRLVEQILDETMIEFGAEGALAV